MVKEFDYDLVVVGAGPAGSSAAYAAAKNGCNVALIEKEKVVAETVRTSGVTWIDYCKEFGIPEDCYNPIRSYKFCSPKNTASISEEIPKAAVLNVRKTYRFLAEQAKESGVDIFLDTTVNDIIKTNENISGVKANSNNEELLFHSKMVIDASGFGSVVVKSLGKVEQWERFGVGAEYEVDVEHVDADSWWLMGGQMYSPAGYAWIFPVSKNRVRIGVGVGKPESEIDPTKRLDEMIKNKLGPIKDLGKLSNKEFHYGLIPNEGLTRKTVYDNLILVGDSAGMANPLVLEGIRYAIKYGRLAGNISATALHTGNTSEKFLERYEQVWKKEIDAKINSAHKVQKRWLNLTDDDWDKEITIISELTSDEFLDFIRADFSISKIIKLATHHPKLAVRQLFNIVRGG